MTRAKAKKWKPHDVVEVAHGLLDLALRMLPHIRPNLMLFGDDGLRSAHAAFTEVTEIAAEHLGVTLIHFNENGCHWNPTEKRRAKAGDEHNTKVRATVRVGVERFPLCGECACIGAFSKKRKREVILP